MSSFIKEDIKENQIMLKLFRSLYILESFNLCIKDDKLSEMRCK